MGEEPFQQQSASGRRPLTLRDFPSSSHEHPGVFDLIWAHKKATGWTDFDDHELRNLVLEESFDAKSAASTAIYEKMNHGPNDVTRAGVLFLNTFWKDEELIAFERSVLKYGYGPARLFSNNLSLPESLKRHRNTLRQGPGDWVGPSVVDHFFQHYRAEDTNAEDQSSQLNQESQTVNKDNEAHQNDDRRSKKRPRRSRSLKIVAPLGSKRRNLERIKTDSTTVESLTGPQSSAKLPNLNTPVLQGPPLTHRTHIANSEDSTANIQQQSRRSSESTDVVEPNQTFGIETEGVKITKESLRVLRAAQETTNKSTSMR